MNKLRISGAAKRDLDAIQDKGLEDFGVKAVRLHMQGFERVFALLREHPSAGESRPDYGDAIRVFAHRPHRVLYRIAGDTVVIIRVLHAAMDVRGTLGATQ